MKKITKLSTKAKAVAGSALFLGATIVGGAAMATAQDGSSGNLGDYPTPFVDDGEVDTNIVVGEDAQTIDVVGGIDIAGALSQHAFTEEEVEVESDGVAGWSATNGLTLNRANSHLYIYDNTQEQISVAEEGDLTALDSVEFDNEEDDTVTAEFEVEVGVMDQRFDADSGDLDDPVLYTLLNAETDSIDDEEEYTFALRTEFTDETVDFSNDEMDNEQVYIMGQQFTVDADETSNDNTEIVVYGASETFNAEYREPYTFEVDGNEHTVEVRFVPENEGTVTVRVDGETQSLDDSDSFTVSGQEVRVTDIFRTGPDGEGEARFAIGSDEYVFEHGNEVEVEGEDIDGTQVEIEGDANGVEEINVYVGPEDSDYEVLEAGDSWSDQVFEVAELHYGGIATNAAEDPAETVEVANTEDDSAIEFTTDNGYDADITYATQQVDGSGDKTSTVLLGADDEEEESISTFEGEWMNEDDYFVLNVDESASFLEVTDVSWDGSGSQEHEVEFEDVHTGSTIELDEDDFDASDTAEFRHNREDYVATIDSANNGQVMVERDTAGANIAVYPNLYTETHHAVAFTATADVVEGHDVDGGSYDETWRLPSTKSTSDQTADILLEAGTGTDDATLTVGADEILTNVDGTESETATIGAVDYEFTVDVTSGSDVDLSIAPDATDEPSAVLMEPEDDADNEHAFVFTPEVSGSDVEDGIEDLNVWTTHGESELQADNADTDGAYAAENDDDNEVEMGYTTFGTYTEKDIDSDQEEIELGLIAGQSTSGFAVTDVGGSLSSTGGAAQDVTTSVPSGWSEAGLRDSEVGSSERNQNMILVGGPVVNTLVEELADDGKTQSAADYTDGQAIIQHIPGAFTEDADALVVAGQSGQDTRDAASALVNMNTEEGTILGEDVDGVGTVTIDTGENQVVDTGMDADDEEENGEEDENGDEE